MSGYNCICPVCGHMNYGLDLVETSGDMECEQFRKRQFSVCKKWTENQKLKMEKEFCI